MDTILYTSIYASQTNITALRHIFDSRVVTYGRWDGKDGRPDWRAELKDKLKDYISRFPNAILQSKKRRKSCNIMAANALRPAPGAVVANVKGLADADLA